MALQTTIDILWRKFWGMKIAILAGLLTGAETLVTMGIELPGSKALPQWGRGLLYMTIITLAFTLRWLALRNQNSKPE